MGGSARDKLYGRRGGRWAENWSDEDEARYQAAIAQKRAAEEAADAGDDQGSLFNDRGIER